MTIIIMEGSLQLILSIFFNPNIIKAEMFFRILYTSMKSILYDFRLKLSRFPKMMNNAPETADTIFISRTASKAYIPRLHSLKVVLN